MEHHLEHHLEHNIMAYLVDFLTLESLSNIYTGSVRDMINRLEDLDVCCDMEQVLNMDYSDQNNTGA
jgi:hypothetical protein